jgi:prepilin-type N-terminal cleavage/methylation domain-containing protein
MKARRGFSLVETTVGLTLLSIVLTSVARLDYNVMRSTLDVSRSSYANASLVLQVNRFLALPYDSLNAHAGCVTVTAPPVPNTACATVTQFSPGVKQVRIVLTVTGVAARPDTVLLHRGSLTSGNPFNSP